MKCYSKNGLSMDTGFRRYDDLRKDTVKQPQ